MLIEFKHYKFLYFCPYSFKNFFYQYVFFKGDKIHFINCFSECYLFEKTGAVVSYSCAFEFSDLPSVDDISYETY